MPAQAYPSRLTTGEARSRDTLSRIAASRSPATIHIGAKGKRGSRFGSLGGVRSDSVVMSVAVHVPGAVLVPAVAVQVAGVPSAVVPLMNVTVPVGPAALFVPVTFAVSVTLPPELMLVPLEVTTVVVTWLPAAAVTVIEGEVEVA
jgi:hypothetical protein